MTPRSLSLMKAFWFYGRYSEAMSFSRFALLSQKSQFTVPKFFHCLASPGKVSALALYKSEASMNKEKHSLRNFAALESGGATQRNSFLPQTWLLIQKVQIFKMTFAQKNGSRIKVPSSKLTILVSSCWENNFIRNNAHNFFILSLVFLKLLIVSIAFFLGHPVWFVRLVVG